MSDYTELQAELAAKKSAGWQCTDGLSIDTVLALIAENYSRRNDLKNLRTDNAQLIYALKQEEQNYLVLRAERDQLKAEVAGLKTGYEAYEQTVKELRAEVEALREDAERYRWLQHGHSGYIEVVEWIGPHATGMTGEDLDALVDAAMGKGEQS